MNYWTNCSYKWKIRFDENFIDHLWSVVVYNFGCVYQKTTFKRLNIGSLYFHMWYIYIWYIVTYKMAALTFKTMSSSTPAYLNDLIQTAVPFRLLRSSDAPLLIVPKTRTEFCRRSFLVAAPYTWNSLPSNVRSCHTVDTFKRHLKTHLFRQS